MNKIEGRLSLFHKRLMWDTRGRSSRVRYIDGAYLFDGDGSSHASWGEACDYGMQWDREHGGGQDGQ